jgi:hypothetical protein
MKNPSIKFFQYAWFHTSIHVVVWFDCGNHHNAAQLIRQLYIKKTDTPIRFHNFFFTINV